jgi:hypothetical protein
MKLLQWYFCSFWECFCLQTPCWSFALPQYYSSRHYFHHSIA